MEAVGLTVRLNSAIHGVVEPAARMLKSDYDAALSATRNSWETVWPT